MKSFSQNINEYLVQSQENNQLRQLKETLREDGVFVKRGGKSFISFSCNDYLGLSQHPKVKKAAIDAIEKYGTGAGASRFITGNYPLYSQLESCLAKIKNTESAIVFGSGYLANIGIIPALVKRGDLIIADKLIHASLLDGAKLSGAKILRFAHNNVAKCQELLETGRKNFKNCLIITDNVFSMDGDVAPVKELFGLANQYDALLMTDDAHGLGVLNNTVSVHIAMGTLSKAVGCYGGYVCASDKIIGYLRNKARSQIYSTALPPSVVASAIAALDIISTDKGLTAKPMQNAKYFTSQLGIKEAVSPIVPLILGSQEQAMNASSILEGEGFLVQAIRPPTVPLGTSRLRFTFSALHKRQDIDKLVDVIKKRLKW